MAELILTDDEKSAALWRDLDDAALGKLVKKKMALITDAATELDLVTTFAAAMLLCCSAAEQNANTMTLQFTELTQGGRDFGDWEVIATKKQGNAERNGSRSESDCRAKLGDLELSLIHI